MSSRALALAGAFAAALAGCSARRPEPPVPAPAPEKAPAAAPEAAKLCAHRVPAELCARCNPELVAVFQATGDWCAEHGVPESQCFACNPDLRFDAPKAPADWCKEHAIAESKCTKCHPEKIAAFIQAGDWCRDHGFPASACPRCHPEQVSALGLEPPAFPAPGTKVRLASAEAARDAGLRTAKVERRPFAPALEVVGTLEFDPERLARVSARGEATVLEVKADVGDEVRAGRPLVVLSSAAAGADRARLSAARARLEAARLALARERGLAEKGIAARSEVEAAEREVAEAQGEHDAAAAGARASGAGGGTGVVLAAPRSGTVVSREAVPGQTVAAGQLLVQIADLSTLAAELEVPEDEARHVRVGQRAEVRLEGTDEALEGRVARVAPAVDPRTRTVRARVVLPNADRSLRAGRFVRARIRIGDERAALLVPRDAVQRAEGVPLAFVKTDEGVYEPVRVRLGARAGGDVEVTEGLSPGAEVVTVGAFLLKTELVKDSIGAGCCDVGGEK